MIFQANVYNRTNSLVKTQKFKTKEEHLQFFKSLFLFYERGFEIFLKEAFLVEVFVDSSLFLKVCEDDLVLVANSDSLCNQELLSFLEEYYPETSLKDILKSPQEYFTQSSLNNLTSEGVHLKDGRVFSFSEYTYNVKPFSENTLQLVSILNKECLEISFDEIAFVSFSLYKKNSSIVSELLFMESYSQNLLNLSRLKEN